MKNINIEFSKLQKIAAELWTASSFLLAKNIVEILPFFQPGLYNICTLVFNVHKGIKKQAEVHEETEATIL